jgi:hypothetical protein
MIKATPIVTFLMIEDEDKSYIQISAESIDAMQIVYKQTKDITIGNNLRELCKILKESSISLTNALENIERGL